MVCASDPDGHRLLAMKMHYDRYGYFPSGMRLRWYHLIGYVGKQMNTIKAGLLQHLQQEAVEEVHQLVNGGEGASGNHAHSIVKCTIRTLSVKAILHKNQEN